jgi:outer membrane protein assembly factor BamD
MTLRFKPGSQHRLSSRFIVPLVAVMLAVSVAGCDTISSLNPFGDDEVYKPEIKPAVPAEVMYNQGLAFLSENSFDSAAKRFAKVDREYPFSTWSKKALIMQTFAHYNARNYDEAAITGKRFLGLYPASDDAAYAAYMVANSYYNQIPDTARDQDRADKALMAFREVVERWPKSEYVEDSRYKITVVQDQLAGREMDIARFYLEKRNYTAAINRFRAVVSNYQRTNQTEEALARLAEAYLALGIVNEAQTAAAVLGHNYPDSVWYKDTYNLLQTKGLEPRESTDSWMSKAFKSVGLG